MAENAELEANVSQALFVARRLERALYEDGEWTVTWGPYEVPASKTVTEAGVIFTARFDELCWVGKPADMMLLKVNGDIVSLRPFDSNDASFLVTWRLLCREHELVA